MSNSLHPPATDLLIPPLLAHLPASFTSPLPPPSLYPLLAPILRNRIRLLLDPPPAGDSWVSLLSWNANNGRLLASHLASLDLSPDPSSGELSTGLAILNGVRRIDEETLNASVELSDWGIVVIYTWCTNDSDPDGEDDGWRVLDVHTADCADDVKWHITVTAAEDDHSSARKGRTLADVALVSAPEQAPADATAPEEGEDNDDDDYWNMYDRSSAATPAARGLVPVDPPTEVAYFDRYSTVESALDSSEPEAYRRYSMDTTSTPQTAVSPTQYTVPHPISSESNQFSFSEIATRLEESANHHIQTEVAIKQHISTSLKSLYRLAKAAGIGRDEFETIVHTELSVLSMMDQDDG